MKEHPLMGYALSFMAGAYFALIFRVSSVFLVALLAAFIIFTLLFIWNQKRPWVFMLFIFALIGYLLCAKSIPDWYFENYITPEECQITGTVESVKSTGYSYEYVLTDVQLSYNEIESKIKITNVTDRDYIEEGYKIRLKAVLERPAAAQQSGMFAENRYYMTRITSYNVCYTKLLRLHHECSAAQLHCRFHPLLPFQT